jgi:hypothetical protein
MKLASHGPPRGGPLVLRAAPVLLVWLGAACEALVDGQLGQVECVSEGAYGPPSCPIGLTCLAGACMVAEWGGTCAADADCLPSEFCLDPHLLGGQGPLRCSRTCCTSNDCDPARDSVCWLPPAGGGAFCRPALEIGRSAGGTSGPLAPCLTDADCRSGRCTDGSCADTCCSDTSCAPLGACRLAGPPHAEALGFWCGPPAGSASAYAPCQADSDCASGLCLDFGLKQPVCSVPCCTSNDCNSVQGVSARCVMLGGTHVGVRACLAEQATGSGAVGVACGVDADCRGGMCLDLAGRSQCSDLCCSDESCGAPESYVCRPALLGSSWALRCAPK